MAYIGKEPIVGNFQICDAISVVNGQAAYTMQVESTNVSPESANHMLVSLNGILQKPGSSFTMYVLDFDKDSDEHAQFVIAFPNAWNLGTITFQAFWSGTANTGGVSWGLQGVACGDNDTIDVAYGTAVVVDDTEQGAVEEVNVSAESGAVTIAGSPADAQLCYFRIFRDVSDANDDSSGDARLHGIKLFFTVDSYNDS